MKKVILCPNLTREESADLAEKVNTMLVSGEVETVCCPMYANEAVQRRIECSMRVSELEKELDSAGIVIVFGGEGTSLRAARAAAGTEVPILGVNVGKIGFMAELEPRDLWMIPAIVNGQYGIQERMLIDYSLIRGGETVMSGYAINDVVVGGVMKIVDLKVCGDGQQISHFAGDGVIIATPTGSTAYSMAAGGPIVEPTAENIIITPVCAHVLAARSFVLAPDRRVSVEFSRQRANPGYLSVDGGESCQVYPGDIICVGKSDKKVRFVDVPERSFYNKVFEKLGERY